MIKNKLYYVIFLGILFQSIIGFSQEEPEDIELETSEFQEAFYASLREKGIENYDKAINALQKCLTLEPNNPVVHFELGKNFLYQKDYKNAYDSFEKATQLEPNNRWYWVGLYDAYYATRDYSNAIVIMKKLIEFKKEYKEDLVPLYMFTQQYDEALKLIDELTETVGKTEIREQFRNQIMSTTRYQGQKTEKLLEAIKSNPKTEDNYVALIYLYSENNQEDKALEIAKKLEKEIPDSDWAQVSLFKFNIDKNNGENAASAMHKILKSPKIDQKIKHRVFNEFLIFTKDNPSFSTDLEKAIAYFRDDREVKVAKEVGKFYEQKTDWSNAVKYYELFAKSNPDDIENVLLLFNAYAQNNQFEILAKQAEEKVELYPLQPDFYYYAGLANNQLKNFKKAKDLLESGIDYIVDNKSLEANFYIQLGEAYHGLNDTKKKENYFIKADKLLKEIK
ncbi:tetratricopeptide repeat protein [Flavobacterium sp.]|uniref:tetratricopeptide repeat protein n=1 Tax=Flavobacterium sp. TaxID=239 RepID=UPI00352758B6